MKYLLINLPSERQMRYQGRWVSSFMDGFEQVLGDRDADYNRIQFDDANLWRYIGDADVVICRPKGNRLDLSIATPIVYEAEKLGKRCYPNGAEIYYCGDKMRIHQFCQAQGIKHPKTLSVFSLEQALAAIQAEAIPLPVVVKNMTGASSKNVGLATSVQELRAISRSFFGGSMREGDLGSDLFSLRSKLSLSGLKRLRRPVLNQSCIIFQEFVPNCTRDVRVTVIGDYAFVFERENRAGDFRASGSGRIDYSERDYHPRAVRLAFDISKNNGFNCMAYDFLADDSSNPYLVEMNYTFRPQAIEKCTVMYNACGELKGIKKCTLHHGILGLLTKEKMANTNL